MKLTVLAGRSRPVLIVVGAASFLLATGCQSTPTGDSAPPHASSRSGTKPTPEVTLVDHPRPVVVHDFAFDLAHVHTDPGLLAGREGPARRVLGNLHPEEPPAQKAARFAELLSQTIAKELADRNIPARREPRGNPWPADGLVVGGEFLELDEGHRLQRAIVGFGSGATEVLVQVAVYDLAQSRQQPVLVYGTGTGSKPMPGGIVSLNPYAMAAKYVLSRKTTEKDVRKLGKRIAADLAQVEASGGSPH